jgi:hypothetical protein
MYVIADSSQGVTTDAWEAGLDDLVFPPLGLRGRPAWNPQLAPWVYGNNLSLVASEDLLRLSAEAYPHAKVAQFTRNFDGVQILFYCYIKQFYPPTGTPSSCTPPPLSLALDWNGQMLATLDDYATNLGNYRYYLAGGFDHMILRFPSFYTESSAGIPFSSWVGAMLQNRGGTNGVGGGAWQDVACPTCLP